MADRLIVADSESAIACLKTHYGDDSATVLCREPLFSASHQPAARNPARDKFNFDPLPAAKELTAALAKHREGEILLAFPPDTPSEMLCWQIDGYAAQIGIRPERVRRLKPAGFTEDEIESAFRSIAPPDVGQGQAAYCRTLFDDCLARHLTRLLGTSHGPGNLPLRHHPLVILFLLNDRQLDQRMARHLQKWQLQAQVEADGNGFSAALTDGLDLPAHGLFPDKTKAMALAKTLGAQPFIVDSISVSDLHVPPPAPYSLAELAQDAFVRFGIAPSRTAEIVAKLYLGVNVRDRAVGLVTSPFPDTPPPAASSLSALREFAGALHGTGALGEASALAAGTIIPLPPQLDDATIDPNLDEDETALYRLIRTRAIASQMRPAAGQSMTVDFLVGKEHIFQARFHEITDHGFLQVMPEQLTRWQVPCPIRDIAEGQRLQAAIICQQNAMSSSSIESYTLETLLDALADFAIRPEPQTIALIGEMAERGYLFLSRDGFLDATPQTAKVASILSRAFPKMAGLNLSAYIEQTINEAVSGRKELAFALKQFDQTLMLHGKSLVKAKIAIKVPASRPQASSTIIRPTEIRPAPSPAPAPSPSGATELAPAPEARPAPEAPPSEPTATGRPPSAPVETAPEEIREEPPLPADVAGAEPIPPAVAEAPAEAVVAEEPAPEIQTPPQDLLQLFADAIEETVPETRAADVPLPAADAAPSPEPRQTAASESRGKVCPDCGRAMAIKEDQFGTYWGCSGFPVCRHSESISLAAREIPCPLCGQVLSRKQTATGKEFFACANEACQFMSWSLPHYLPCGLCDSPYLIEKTTRGVVRLHCPRAGCPYAQPMPDATGDQSAGEPAEAGSLAPPQPETAKPVMKKVLVRRSGSKGATTGTGTRKVRIVRRRT